MRRRFFTLDVFTETPFAGNPLAVVIDCDGLTSERMQQIAREFALSETVFVTAPRNPINSARIRIFTPASELPFAGHPTVGAAILIAQLDAAEFLSSEDLSVVIEEEIGLGSCTVGQRKGRAPRAVFAIPRLPEMIDAPLDIDALAAALGIDAACIGFDGHQPSVWSAGNAFVFVPVDGLETIANARPDMGRWDAALPEIARKVFVYTREVEQKGSAFHARMFAPSLGIAEDPATGSAVAAFAGVLRAFEEPYDGEHHFIIEQGFEMGRPSLITLTVEIEQGKLASAQIGGAAVRMSEGVIDA